MEILNAYLALLWGCFQFDVGVYTNGWLYAPALIPIIFYTFFFVIKWAVLLAPITIPFTIISNAIRNAFSVVKPTEYTALKASVEELKAAAEAWAKDRKPIDRISPEDANV